MAMSELTLSAHQATNLLLALRAVERLPVLTQDIIQATEEGEAYETLCRQLRCLHGNLLEIAATAVQANFAALTTIEALQPPHDDLPLLIRNDRKGQRAVAADR